MRTVYQKNIETDDMDSISDIMNRYNNYIPLTGNEGVLSDVLQVDDANKGSVLHKKYSITQGSSYGYLTNMPDIISDKTSMIFRDVFYRSNGNILIRLLELYPVAGRVWYNGMTKSSSTGLTSWSGWSCSQPKDILLLNTTKYGVNFRIWGNPNEIHYRTSGSTTGEILTKGAHVPIGTLPVGYRPAINQFTYFIIGGYRCQIRFQTDGEVAIGYSAILSTGSSENIPAGVGCYTCGTIGLQSGE